MRFDTFSLTKKTIKNGEFKEATEGRGAKNVGKKSKTPGQITGVEGKRTQGKTV